MTLNDIILLVFVFVFGLRGVIAVLMQRIRVGGYGALPPVSGRRAVFIGVVDVLGVSAILISHLMAGWPDTLRTVLLFGGGGLMLILETIGVLWAQRQT